MHCKPLAARLGTAKTPLSLMLPDYENLKPKAKMVKGVSLTSDPSLASPGLIYEMGTGMTSQRRAPWPHLTKYMSPFKVTVLGAKDQGGSWPQSTSDHRSVFGS